METVKVKNTQPNPITLGRYKDQYVCLGIEEEAELPLDWNVTQAYIDGGFVKVLEKPQPKRERIVDNTISETKRVKDKAPQVRGRRKKKNG